MTTQDSPVQYAYALDNQGILTHISDAERSNTYTCPGCKIPLIPVLGETNAKHFRHSEECCALESYLHRCAKEAFFYCYEQALNKATPIKLELKRTVYCNSVRLKLLRNKKSQCQKSVPARYNLTEFFGQVQLERRDSDTGLKPDVMLSDPSGNKRCYVEICVTHPCTQEKIETGIPILEFKIETVDDIQMLLSGSYSVSDKRLSAYNWRPPSQTVNICSAPCKFDDIEMSVWSLSDSGRLNEQKLPFTEVDPAVHSNINTWPKAVSFTALSENLRSFLLHKDPDSQFPNCLLCRHSSQWASGYMLCNSKAKQVPYTDARQCANYEPDA